VQSIMPVRDNHSSKDDQSQIASERHNKENSYINSAESEREARRGRKREVEGKARKELKNMREARPMERKETLGLSAFVGALS